MNNFKVFQTPNKDLAETNRVFFNPNDIVQLNINKYVKLHGKNKFVYQSDKYDTIPSGLVGMNGKQRDENDKKIDDNVIFENYYNNIANIKILYLQIDTRAKLEIDCDELSNKIKLNLVGQPLSLGQTYACSYSGVIVYLLVKTLDLIDSVDLVDLINSTDNDIKSDTIGLVCDNTIIIYSTTRKNIDLINQTNGLTNSIIKNNMSFSNIPVGGLGKEFNEIFVKAFLSRIQPDIARKMGIKHTKGILLYGSPGCGKCLGINTPVLMFDQTIKMVQDIIVGDKLMGDDKTERIVYSLARGREQMYKICQKEGDDYVVNESHILSLIRIKNCLVKSVESVESVEFDDFVDIELTEYLKLTDDEKENLMGYKVNLSNSGSKFKLTTIQVVKLDIDDYYGFEISGNRRFLLGDHTVTHNTLLAREMGKLLNCVEPKIVAGPSLLNKYYGQSEENVRNLFADAMNDKSDKLHLIIFDEADSLFKTRGSSNNEMGDNVVNQILAMIDGPQELNNVLIMCMTNRKDIIDDAILRSGRIELHIEIKLPDEEGRLEILKIHTKTMNENNYLSPNVDLQTIAKITENFTGAELAQVIKDASSFALSREIYISDGKIKNQRSNCALDPVVTMDDIIKSVNEIVPMFGRASAEIQAINMTPFVFWNDELTKMHNEIIDGVVRLKYGKIHTVLICGSSFSGKTKFVANLAKTTGISCVKIINSEKMLRAHNKKKFILDIFDLCSKATNSILILDGIEKIVEWLKIGPRFNNEVLQAISTILGTTLQLDRKMTILCTSNDEKIMEQLELTNLFKYKYELENYITHDQIINSFPEYSKYYTELDTNLELHSGLELVEDFFKQTEYN